MQGVGYLPWGMFVWPTSGRALWKRIPPVSLQRELKEIQNKAAGALKLQDSLQRVSLTFMLHKFVVDLTRHLHFLLVTYLATNSGLLGIGVYQGSDPGVAVDTPGFPSVFANLALFGPSPLHLPAMP